MHLYYPSLSSEMVLKLKFLLIYSNWYPQYLYYIINCYSVKFSFIKVTWKKWSSFFCFVGTFWTRKCVVLVFRNKIQDKSFVRKKRKNKRLYSSGKLMSQGWTIMLPSSCLTDMLRESLHGCIMRGKYEDIVG